MLRKSASSIWLPTLLWLLSLQPAIQVVAQTSYANDFIDPNYFLKTQFAENTSGAQQTVFTRADEFAALGPWSVMNKSATPPSGSKHDYMSWAPYWWPDCSKAGNKTILTPEQIWTNCTYVNRDGLFNPDVRTVDDIGAVDNLADAVFYNSISWALGKNSSYSKRAASFINTWFLDPATQMNPNLNFAQMIRGVNGTNGTHTGVLDLKCMAKIVTGILILREGKSSDWTSDLDNGMVSWSREYITWLETSTLALQEGWSANNHGTFYYNQLAALKLLVNDPTGAYNATNTYFNNQYLSQIIASGEQPLEAARTRPYHYRSYNLAAMITNAHIWTYASTLLPSPPKTSIWNKTTNAGATIQTALNFAMTISPAQSGEQNYTAELWPNVAAVGAVYGDRNGTYASFLSKAEATYYDEAFFLWDQPLAGGPNNSSSGGSVKKGGTNAALRISLDNWTGAAFVAGVVLLHTISSI
ncbi:chondroitin AC/alginate lyase [Pluteus cervinus]|uniref:Chondroitin AC/alginate lyase n=1 Tax=Pluteus cervinus TaxID=181527 RepID=A0ACD3AVX7_9AGAR|nr:chondroitin AC/alginate lyase [Pluteus cervinus]